MGRNSNGVAGLDFSTLFRVGVTASLTDGQLLERFAVEGGEAGALAFAVIVERHGPMVFRVCRSRLKDDHEAIDAFQATFLVLLRKGETLWVRDSLGPWLHRVACRVAGRAKANANRRRTHERHAVEQATRSEDNVSLGELVVALHEEVDRLPNHYRVPVVLCDLEGCTYEEAARHLGCPVGTVRSRLARGRERLRGRLLRRGLSPSAVPLGLVLAAKSATPAMPVRCVGSMLRMATLAPTGSAFTIGEASASAQELAEGVCRTMFKTYIQRLGLGLLAAVGLAALGSGGLAQQAPEVGRSDSEPARPRVQAAIRPPRVAQAERDRVRTLPNGATIEVIGVSTYPSDPKTWWNQDGSPLVPPPCDSSGTDFAKPEYSLFGGDSKFRLVAVRVSNLPQDSNHAWWMRESRCRSEPAVRDGKVVPELSVVVSEFRKGLATSPLHFEVAAGPWQIVQARNGQNPETRPVQETVSSVLWGRAIATKTGTSLTVTHEIKDAAVRLVAVDHQGKEHTSQGRGSSRLNGFSQLEAEFDLSPDEFREYQLQRRPFEQIEIPILLEPSAAMK